VAPTLLGNAAREYVCAVCMHPWTAKVLLSPRHNHPRISNPTTRRTTWYNREKQWRSTSSGTIVRYDDAFVFNSLPSPWPKSLIQTFARNGRVSVASGPI
jgi:hypothetical protein